MTTVTPMPKHLDARQRAFRTFVGSLLAVVLAAAGTALTSALDGGIHWTREYWVATGAAVGLAALNAAVAYVMRYWAPPSN